MGYSSEAVPTLTPPSVFFCNLMEQESFIQELRRLRPDDSAPRPPNELKKSPACEQANIHSLRFVLTGRTSQPFLLPGAGNLASRPVGEKFLQEIDL